MTRKRRRGPESPDRVPQARKAKLAMLKKAVEEDTYEINAADIAGKILKNLVLEFAPVPKTFKT